MDKERSKELRSPALSVLKDLSSKLEVIEIMTLLSSSYSDVIGLKDIEQIWPNCKLISLNSSFQSTKQLGEWVIYGEIKTHELLSPADIAEIRRLRKEGSSMSAIGKFFNKSTSCIANIVHNRTYKIK
ncbi:helix-turn-helix domain-containing protein [Candidatus Pacearchaeota archaeon]|nr:helix-turn-helix domain-containing protein [Candidatus Pacearchaeota archaeon]